MKKLNLHIFRARPKERVTVFPACSSINYLASEKSVKKYGCRIISIIDCFTNNDLIATINSDDVYRGMGNLLIDKYFSKRGYLEKLIKWSEANKDLLIDNIEKNLGEQIIGKLTNHQIAQKYVEYCELYEKYHFKNTPSWLIGGDALLTRVREFLQDKHIDPVDSIIAQLTDVTGYKTENFEEGLSILNIALFFQKKRIKKVNDKILEKYPKIKLVFEKHVRDFFSIPFAFNTGIIWGREYFFKKINDILVSQDAKKLIQKRLDEVKNRQKKQDNLLVLLSLPKKIKNYFKFLRQLAYLQELRKTTQTRSHPTLQLVVKKEIAKRLNTTIEHIDYMSHFEVSSCLHHGKISAQLLKPINQRMKASVLIMKDYHYKWLIGKEARKFFKVNGIIEDISKGIKEIRGFSASAGCVKGTAKVCRLSNEIGKIQEGDIMITAMTTPDFVPAMKKAGAIITDEGGITCHAAIISRELNKPCIIGTKIATKVLHDGDLVEVDADKGIVKILKKK